MTQVMYKILQNRHVHNLIQKILSLGRKRVLHITENLIKNNCNGTVLDVGCGTLRYAHLFKNNYYGLDININYCGDKLYNGIEFICGNAISLPFKDNSFDSVFSVGFFHHISPNDTKKVFQEIIRVCKPGANILIIDAFYPDNKYDILGFLFAKADRGCFFRRKESFLYELKNYFSVVHMLHIDNSYPYNLYSFVLRAKH